MKNKCQGRKMRMYFSFVLVIFFTACRPSGNDANGQAVQVSTNNQAVSGTPPVTVNPPDFVSAARLVTPSVVHIKTMYSTQNPNQSPLERAFGGGEGGRRAMGSGSGVVISRDGYIATNNHVIENASNIEVVFPDRRSFPAELIGRDPNTDLALLKVKADNLVAVKIGNSDITQVGEWVLAIGYPYSLNTTVTAGIISAKGRSIGIIERSMQEEFGQGTAQAQSSAIESFIQTDAAINPGNSGGALVNTRGELIGINAAIASLTGSYAGYSFAIPINLASKILEDLRESGRVKRGILGVAFPSPTVEDQYLKQLGINPGSFRGVFITDVKSGSAAADAGLKEGDIIQRINGVEINSSSEFSEWIARQRPGDKISIEYLRNGKKNTASATLKSEESVETVADNSTALREIYNKLGATISPLSADIKRRLNLESGVVVSEVRKGGFFDRIGIPPGTIIGYINGAAINTPEDINEALIKARNGRVQILGIAPDGSRIMFNFYLGA